ncbi:NADH-cytochrome b5 reductase-like [Drosophila innubila]|uniref:NADH-cytochrome b5 reductase-like n=1 Tax=Drosophila innubila TaxID=198719 RepID=UPI00148E839C|nr:NADH-cytochrome b5 reductase-like [Drosophila innubila]
MNYRIFSCLLFMPDNEIDETDCCGNGCTNCILDNDNKPKPSKLALLAGKRNVILSYTNFRLISNKTHNGDAQIRLLHFVYAATTEDEDGDDDTILDIPPGHHVMLRAQLTDHATPLLRPYSPYWTDFAGKEFKILVKLQPDGAMSGFLSALQPLQVLQFRGPIGNYVHDTSSAKCIVIIAQGVAIAPTMPLVSQVLDNEDDINRIRHLICAQDLQHVYFRERLLEFAQYWNYHSCLYLTHQECTCSSNGREHPCEHLRKQLRYKEAAHTGRLDAKQLASQVLPQEESIIVIVAGHSSFQRHMREVAVNALNVTDDNIFLL